MRDYRVPRTIFVSAILVIAGFAVFLKAFSQDRWVDASGKVVQGKEIEDERGDAHCAWADVPLLALGIPIGSDIRTTPNALFLRDETGAVNQQGHLTGSFEVLERLPEGAVRSGFRKGDRELWLGSDLTEIYIKEDSLVEKWPRLRPDRICK